MTFCFSVQNLVSLNLRGLRVSSNCLNQIIQNFTILTILNLSHCHGCSDSVLENIAKHCPNIKNLNVEGCSQITDRGIEGLVLAADVSSRQALNITSINASSTSATRKSLWTLLDSLPLLLSLSFARIKTTARKCVSDDTLLMNINIVQLQLQCLDISDTSVEFDQLKLVLDSCPRLIELKLTIPSCENGYADSFKTFCESLKNLSKLKSLGISILDEPRPQPFVFEWFGSFLQENGHQLESLELNGPVELSLHIVCLYCCSLKQLVLCDCQLVQPFLPSLEKQHCKTNTGCDFSTFSDFCSLEYIDLDKVQFKEISLHEKQELLYRLLAFLPCLRRLSLKSVPIEESVLIRILHTPSGVDLQKLVLSCYDNITVKTIHAITDICPNLNTLELFHCWVITWYDVWKTNDSLKQIGRKLEVVDGRK